tara:strand:+ start:1636 stop:2313 length:678 start_codon:yes stop_codon:yes gene_type:complete
MSRELPYFKFFTGEWLNGDITLEDLELQGLFINVCAYYWHRECKVNYQQLSKKFRSNQLENLVPEFMKCDEENDHIITIEFLDEQFAEFTTRKKKLSNAGKKGAQIKKDKARFVPPLSHPLATREEVKEDKSKKKTIEERKTAFKESLATHLEKYDKNTLNEFFSYWSEYGDNDKKMRYEKQTSFSISRRLGTWKLNQKKFENGSQKNSKDNRATTTKSERQNFN